MSTFDDFWRDERIPKRMKRCGKPKVQAALRKRKIDHPEGYEAVLASLPGYDRNKPDYHDHHMLSTYINQQLDEVEWDDMDEPIKRDPWDVAKEMDEFRKRNGNVVRLAKQEER